MPRHISFSKIFRRFLGDQNGNIAMMLGLMLVPLTLAAGVGIDYAQAQNFKNALQGAVDAASLAGASAYTSTSGTSTPTTIATNYMNNAISKLPPNKGVTFTVSPATVTSGGKTTGYTIAVSASGSVSTAFMSLVAINTVPVTVAATSENPETTASVSLNGFTSSACDGNSIYWYPIPSSANPNTYVPPNSTMTQLWSNTTTVTPKSFTLASSSQQIGFALENVTGQKCGYGSNSFGGAQNSTHMFYSNLYPPSKQAYPSVTQNHSLQVAELPAGETQDQVVASMPQQAFNSNFANAAPTCGGLNGKTMVYAWNDMGGTGDDLDYNDGVYTFSCSAAAGSGITGAGVVLVK